MQDINIHIMMCTDDLYNIMLIFNGNGSIRKHP